MIIFEFLLEIIIRIFVEIIFEGIIISIYEALLRVFEFIRVKVFGFEPKPSKSKNRIEKKILYKNIELIENINPKLKAGQKGTILEIINKNKVYAEFYDLNGKQIEFNDKLVFEIRVRQFKIMK